MEPLLIGKIAITLGGLLATHKLYYTIPENKYRKQLKDVFKAGEMYTYHKPVWRMVTSSFVGTRDEKGDKIYPKVHAIQFKENKYVIVFSIPFGVDPEIVEKKRWLFEQQFGENIDFKIDGKRYILTVHTKDQPKIIKFDYVKFLQHIENMKLPIIVGYNESKFEAYDMVPDPNLIISGEPGSGKSTQLRAILTTLILHIPSTKLEMYLGDLKRSEFHLFKRVKHVKAVANDAKEIYKMLIKVEKEMIQRTEILDLWEVTHIDQYNKQAKDNKPYILVAIDEVALIKREKKIMEIVEEISTIGRALGIYLILSMQRPDADVLDGKIKNNITTRMAFRHADDYNSWITLGKGNSQAADIKISEKGKMAWKHETIKYVQGPLLEEDEAKKLLDPLKGPRENVKKMGEVHETKEQPVLGVLDDETT